MDVKFEVFIVVKIQFEVLWVVTLRSIAIEFQCFGGP